ncbi:uncharacterized protein [Antedon mediterranea]|uniref:uncharacterized protein n=1 Tax=Antedon mediterranea TaxID=105859 RepID=UPI003AF5D4E4
MSCKTALVILSFMFNHWMSLAVDVCNNRCQQFKYVYCNKLTAICENCNIYCEDDSQFYSENKCESLGCLDEPVVLDACSNRCLDFPMTYCNEGTGVCDPCEIWCSKDSGFFDVTKCTDKCPGLVSPTSILLIPTTVITTTRPNYITTRPTLTTMTTVPPGVIAETLIPHSDSITSGTSKWNIILICIPVFAVIILVCIGLFYLNRRCKRNTNKLKNQTARPISGKPIETIPHKPVADQAPSDMV